MIAYLDAIHPKGSEKVTGTDVQKNPLSGPFVGDADLLAIPYAGAKLLVTNARKDALPAERDVDDLLKGSIGLHELAIQPGVHAIGGILPRAVEILPQRTLELRSWIFGSKHKRFLLEMWDKCDSLQLERVMIF